MAIFYSRSTSGFHDSTLQANLPPDAIEVTATRYAALLAAQAEGKQIVPDANGAPIEADNPAANTADLMEALRRRRNARLADCDHTQLLDTPLSATERADWATYRQALRDLPEACGENPADAVWPTPPAPTGDQP